ncbi:unnamed protein product [Orchesella dallaii]|uniref:Uncharacterized protein n=1 Tax=Orchesella dallaii TaxID=48710 RepID=A0ABP1QR26_9HEXA
MDILRTYNYVWKGLSKNATATTEEYSCNFFQPQISVVEMQFKLNSTSSITPSPWNVSETADASIRTPRNGTEGRTGRNICLEVE